MPLFRRRGHRKEIKHPGGNFLNPTDNIARYDLPDARRGCSHVPEGGHGSIDLVGHLIITDGARQEVTELLHRRQGGIDGRTYLCHPLADIGRAALFDQVECLFYVEGKLVKRAPPRNFVFQPLDRLAYGFQLLWRFFDFAEFTC